VARALRIVLCTRGGLQGALVLDRLMAIPRAQVCGMVLSTRTDGPKSGFVEGAISRIRRSGFAYAAYLWLSTGGAELALRISGPAPVALRARRAGIVLRATRCVNDADSLAFVRSCAPDLLVSAFFDQHIGDELSGTPALGAVNIHPSPLPRDRGVDPVFFAMLRGERNLGVTLHRIVPAWDAGPILATESVHREADESVLRATARLYDRGGVLLGRHLDALAAGDPGAAQGDEGCYDSWPTREQVAALRGKGLSLAHASDLWWRPIPDDKMELEPNR